MLRISESVEGASVAPARPRTARDAMSVPAVREKDAATEASPKATAPNRAADGRSGRRAFPS